MVTNACSIQEAGFPDKQRKINLISVLVLEERRAKMRREYRLEGHSTLLNRVRYKQSTSFIKYAILTKLSS